jgi:hypothetical protein
MAATLSPNLSNDPTFLKSLPHILSLFASLILFQKFFRD